jgi:hypothetical protein
VPGGGRGAREGAEETSGGGHGAVLRLGALADAGDTSGGGHVVELRCCIFWLCFGGWCLKRWVEIGVEVGSLPGATSNGLLSACSRQLTGANEGRQFASDDATNEFSRCNRA